MHLFDYYLGPTATWFHSHTNLGMEKSGQGRVGWGGGGGGIVE